MRTLQENIKYLRLIGMLYKNEKQQSWQFSNVLFNVIFAMPMSLTIAGTIAYFVEYASDLPEATKVAYTIFALLIYLPTYWIFAIRKLETQRVCNGIQQAVNLSIHPSGVFFLNNSWFCFWW